MSARGPKKGLRQIVTMAMGVVLGVGLTLVSSSFAGPMKGPSNPEALVALGQLMDTEHRRVDLLLEKGDVAGAIEALEDLREGKWPDRDQGGDAAVQLRHDAYGRLLRLRIDHPKVDPKSAQELLTMLDEGLGVEADLVPDNVFTARVVAIRGELLEGLGRDDDALLAYERALDINRGLLDDLLNENRK